MDGVAVRLARLKREAQKEWKRKWRKKLRQAAPSNAAEWRALAAEAAGAVLKVVLIIALPFAVLVRGSVFIYEHGTRSVWLAVATAGILTASVNAKSGPVRAYYRSVHPLLRLALSTAILVDRDILITDTGRVPEDYGRMGLPTNSRTRHYKQKDGWVHAVDLRTTGHGVIKNRGVQFYFWLMGFDTRRHVGTADHLHVELN